MPHKDGVFLIVPQFPAHAAATFFRTTRSDISLKARFLAIGSGSRSVEGTSLIVPQPAAHAAPAFVGTMAFYISLKAGYPGPLLRDTLD